MTPHSHSDVSEDFDADDYPSNPSTARHFSDIVESRLSRRSVLTGGILGATAFLTTGIATAPRAAATPGRGKQPDRRRPGSTRLGYEPVPLGYGDEVVVPDGYSVTPFIPWGAALLAGASPFVPGTPPLVANGNTAEDQAKQFGSDHDGMHYFPLARGRRGSERGLLVLNHENTDEGYLHTATPVAPDPSTYTLEMVRKSQNAHGVAVAEIERSATGRWEVVPSARNRRVTANTPMSFSGPARGNELVTTSTDPAGTSPAGTINNCSHGHTPWNTYLACEENFNGYFRVDDQGQYEAEDAELQARYGVGGDSNNWATNDDRFVVSTAEPNEPNRFGWVVEIDPFDPGSTPVKRTALGRQKHEGAYVHTSRGGRVVVYMGDDQVNEYAYKFVSSGNWRSMRARGISPLDEGTLYVAVFSDDGTGTWLPLVHGQNGLTAQNGFADQGEVLVKTRLAADFVGATPMDRPEWTSVDPNTGTAYLTLTNNTSAAKEENAANPRKPNRSGHIIRWQEGGGDHAATTFAWDLFLIAGTGRGTGDGSTIKPEDGFGSPDGLWVDPDSRVWIQTDGTQPAGANDQMLAADPFRADEQGAPQIKRFLTSVVNAEVTGVITTPDQRTMFVNIQHPGAGGGSTWPHDDGITVPRSATVVITKDDGGVIGS